MAFVEPDVTVIQLVTLTLAGLMEALYAHWAPGGASTKFTASDPTGAPTGSTSFSLLPDDVGETWQMNFRGNLLAIDPGALITDSSNPGATASAAWSGELSALVYATTDGKIAIVEFDDAIFVLINNSDDSAWSYAIHIGKIHTPFFTSDEANGITGLGIIGRQAYYTTSSSNGYPWFNPTVGQFGPDFQKIQLGNTTNEWLLPVQAFGGPAGYTIAWDSGITQEEATLGDGASAVPLVLMQNSGAQCGPRPIGVLRYIYNWWNAATPKTRITDGTGKNLIHIWYANAATRLLIPWDASTLP